MKGTASPCCQSADGEAVESVELLKEVYTENHGALEPDCITCRRTLEHFHDTQGFLETIRPSIGESAPYLFIEGKPVPFPSDKIHPLEESVTDLRAKGDLFVEKTNRQLGGWRDRFARLKEEQKKVVVWGVGSKIVNMNEFQKGLAERGPHP